MNYTLHQLQVFSRVVDLKSITRAAEELHMTQPAVSIQLKNFQDQFDIPLTEIVGRKLFVTDFGMEIYHMTQRILEEVDAINFKTLSYKGFLTGRLKISSVSTGLYVMPYFLSGFLNDNEGVELVMDVTNKSKVIESLQQNEIDFALVSVMPSDIRLNSEQLVENELFLVGNKNHDLGNKSLHKQQFTKLPLIFREEGSGTRFVMEEFFKKNKIDVRKKLELTTNEAVKQAVVSGLGYSVMPLIGIRNELKVGELKIIPVSGFPIVSSWRLVWLKEKKLSPVAEAYLKYLRKEKDRIKSEHFSWITKAGGSR